MNPKDGIDLRQTWGDDEALERGDYDLYRAASCTVGRQAARPFAVQDGEAVLQVVTDEVLASSLARAMGGGSSRDLIRCFADGFRAGLVDGPVTDP